MLLYIPRMYSESEFRQMVPVLPPDLHQKTLEFWDYVREKLRVFSKIDKIYRDELWKAGAEALKALVAVDKENYRIMKKLMEKGAKILATEDPILVAESEAWRTMLLDPQSTFLIRELYQQALEDRCRYISDRINATLEDDEVGVLFIEPSRRIQLPGEMKIIKMFRFDPLDYLKAWQVQLKLKADRG